jgi:RimJ/RimL family protein N-acetyltransferase
MKIRPIADTNLHWVRALLQERWGSVEVVSRNKLHQADSLPGFVAVNGKKLIGLITFKIDNDACEIVTLDSVISGKGVGTALIKAVIDEAKEKNCHRIWLITTNDNIGAIRFYQKAGFSMVAVHRDAIADSRKLKTIIPEIGYDGIPIKHEVEFEIILSRTQP